MFTDNKKDFGHSLKNALIKKLEKSYLFGITTIKAIININAAIYK